MISRILRFISFLFRAAALLMIIAFIAVVLSGYSVEETAGAVLAELAPSVLEWLRQVIAGMFSPQIWEMTVDFLLYPLWSVSLILLITFWIISIIFSLLGRIFPF